MTVRYELEDFARVDFAKLDSFADRMIFQTLPWLKFIAATQKATPVVASLKDGGETVGWFTGLTFKKFGLKLLGSPFPVWTTAYLGFNLVPGFPRRRALEGFAEFAFDRLGCVHAELRDRFLTADEGRAAGFEVRTTTDWEIDLRQDEETLLKNMNDTSRWSIRKAAKSGVVVEETRDPEFYREYHAQVRDVFDKQSLAPAYDIARARTLIESLPPENILLLKAKDKDGKCIATGIFPAFNTHATFWGGYSWREFQSLRPNEAILWHAMKHWKSRGIGFLDMGGMDYKKKYGPYPIEVPYLRLSRYGAVSRLRDLAQKAVRLKQRGLGVIKNWKPS